jgi:ribosomal protein S18 acetylase RimI-like enzyme
MNTSDIKYIKSFEQTQKLQNEIKRIYSICSKHYSVKQPFFIDTDYDRSSELPWLYYATISDTMQGFLSVYPIDDYNVEFCLFVLPEATRQGIGTKLFSMMATDFSDYALQGSLTQDNNIGKSFSQKMGFAFSSTECSMKLTKSDFVFSGSPLSISAEKADNIFIITGIAKGKEIGQVCISDSGSTACIHDVEIYEPFRRKGYGYQLLGTVLTAIFKNHVTAVLHVTKDNYPAYNLYKKLGFNLVESLDYYEL